MISWRHNIHWSQCPPWIHVGQVMDTSTILFIPTTCSSSSCTCFITHGYLKSWEKVHSIAAAKVSYAPEIMSIMIALIFHQTHKNHVLDKINMFLIWTQNTKPNGYYICDSKRFVHVTHSIMLCFFNFCVYIYILQPVDDYILSC